MLKYDSAAMEVECCFCDNLKIDCRNKVSTELLRLREFNVLADNEFSRINSFIKMTSNMMNLILED